MKKLLIKYIPLIVPYFLIVVYGLYGVQVRQKKIYDEYNGMLGTVTSFVVSTHSASVLCNIRLDNGHQSSVNNGYSTVRVGDRWYNDISYNRFFGLQGFAYFITPGEIRSILESFILLMFVYLVVAAIAIYFAWNLASYWIKSH
jgi:hypothetical protein